MPTIKGLARDLMPPALRGPIRRGLERAGILDQSKRSNAAARNGTDSTSYWTEHNVTQHRRFTSREESLDAFDWRSGQYFGYLDLMPVSGLDGRAVLDFGCGPGHDLVGIAHHSRPARLVGADVSSSSLAEARERLALHGVPVEMAQLGGQREPLPFPDQSFDYIHSSGVLHHVEDAEYTLRELRRILRPGGQLRVMIYNYPSIFVHLYAAYQVRMVEKRYADLDFLDAFRRLTDGPDCPISRVHAPEQWAAVARAAGFECTHLGNAISAYEMHLLPTRFMAMLSPQLPAEHRAFLRELTFDVRGLPLHGGQVAGVDGCYRLQHRA